MNFQSWILAWLAASLGRPFILAAAAGMVLRVLRVRHPASRHAVWSAVLVGMLVLPAMSMIMPHWSLPVLAPRIQATAGPGAPVVMAVDAAPQAARPLRAASTWHAPSGESVALWCYLSGLIAMGAYRLAGWILLRRVLARAKPVRGRVWESEDVLTPVAVGVIHPVVILPPAWRGWNVSTRRAVLAHEFAHLRRGDALILALARWAKSVFWFHPLGWWLSGRISDLAELSCDAVVLERSADPAEYSRVLLGFAEAVNGAGRRTALPGLAMAAGSGLSRRVSELFELAASRPRRLPRPPLVLGAVGLPVLCLAAAAGFGERPQEKAASASPQEKPKFEVASVKACKDELMGPTTGPKGGRGGSTLSPGRLDIPCSPLRFYVQLAYIISSTRRGDYAPVMEGAPEWINNERYQMSAKADGPVSRETLNGPMLQSLLEDRFRLKVHHEIREGPSFDLVVAKGGLKTLAAGDDSCTEPKEPGLLRHLDCSKIKRHEAGTCIEWDRTGTPPRPGEDGSVPCGIGRATVGAQRVIIDFLGASLNDIAHSLGRSGRPVFDKTSVEGLFDFHLEFLPDGVDSADSIAVPSIFAALGRLGLRLDPARANRDYLVVDHVERPTAN